MLVARCWILDAGCWILDSLILDAGFLILNVGSSIQHPVSSIQYPASSIQHPVSSIQHPNALLPFLILEFLAFHKRMAAFKAFVCFFHNNIVKINFGKPGFEAEFKISMTAVCNGKGR
jgi:hypothetical protein